MSAAELVVPGARPPAAPTRRRESSASWRLTDRIGRWVRTAVARHESTASDEAIASRSEIPAPTPNAAA